MPAATIVVFAALVCVIAAAVDDIRRYAIADGWPIAIAGLFAVHSLLASPQSWPSHVAAPALVFVLGLICFARGYIGGGDVKLLTAIASWTGLGELADLLAATAVAGGILTILLVAARSMRPSDNRLRLLEKAAPVPYAVAIAAGTLAWGLRSDLI